MKIKLSSNELGYQLSDHFHTDEFRCKCCNCLVLDRKLIVSLENFRHECGKPLHILSGYRCQEHNAEIGGVKNSGHTKGVAADIRTPTDWTTRLFGKVAAETMSLTGIRRVGVYDGYQGKRGFIHIGIKRHPWSVNLWGDLII